MRHCGGGVALARTRYNNDMQHFSRYVWVVACLWLVACGAADTSVPPPAADTSAPPPPSDMQQGRVVHVVDGDTFDVQLNGREERVRLIGLNTPESVDPRRPVQCFGVEASDFAKRTLDGATVGLELDDSQGDRDPNGRLLRYVWLDDGRLFNQTLIREGYAFEYTYNQPYKYQALFRDAQRTARATNAGLWSPDTCDGEATDVAPPPGSQAPADERPPRDNGNDNRAACDPAYPDVCIPPPPPDLDCRDITERNFRVLPPDPHNFDGAGDGFGCEPNRAPDP